MSTDISLWLAALVVLLIIEMITQGLTTVWFAIGCAGAAVCAAFDLPILVQCIVFLIISVITLLFTRPIAVKYFNSKSVPTNVEALFGTEARVIEKIDPIEGTGRVNVGGQ
ncbi:MAG: NfeD family protein, partial [Lachnospiraceae bacterium]|nr:NfeD family protein [Lachnospiraceae bacterium]